mmetsp:Transcript_50463/g.126467  ORF Transcript_50463/g.126467 Transcript_50463/m.126467 type:complete len:216 (+) Transcript_50463:51-698(+)
MKVGKIATIHIIIMKTHMHTPTCITHIHTSMYSPTRTRQQQQSSGDGPSLSLSLSLSVVDLSSISHTSVSSEYLPDLVGEPGRGGESPAKVDGDMPPASSFSSPGGFISSVGVLHRLRKPPRQSPLAQERSNSEMVTIRKSEKAGAIRLSTPLQSWSLGCTHWATSSTDGPYALAVVGPSSTSDPSLGSANCRMPRSTLPPTIEAIAALGVVFFQ